jgi:hypothetical protein
VLLLLERAALGYERLAFMQVPEITMYLVSVVWQILTYENKVLVVCNVVYTGTVPGTNTGTLKSFSSHNEG